MAYVIGIPILTSVYAPGGIPGGGGGVPEITATLSTNDPVIVPTLFAATVTITLSEVREVDTEFTIISTNPNVEIQPSNPISITAGNLTVEFSVSSSDGSGGSPFEVDVTADGVTSTGPLQLEFGGA